MTLLLFVSYCVGIPVIVFLCGLFGEDKLEDSFAMAVFWPLLAVACVCFGIHWVFVQIHKAGEYLHDKTTPKE